MTLCPRCQKRNPDEATRCQYCGALILHPAVGIPAAADFTSRSEPIRSQTSGMAIASLVLGLLGLFSVGLTALVGLVLGIVGLRQIGRSEGRLQGQGLAIGGIIVSGLVLAIMFLFVPITAAILFPVFSAAREKARASVCISRLRQVGMAMSLYTQDYDEHWPRRQNWCDRVLPYLRSPRGGPAATQLQCPSLPNQPAAYAYNELLSGASQNQIGSPDATAVLFDSQGGWNLAGGSKIADPRHSGGLYVLFAAGNTRWMTSFDAVVWKPRPAAAPAVRRPAHRRQSRPRRE